MKRVIFLSSSVMPGEGVYVTKDIDEEQLRQIFLTIKMNGLETESYVGHTAVIQEVERATKVRLRYCRGSWVPRTGDVAIIVKPRFKDGKRTFGDYLYARAEFTALEDCKNSRTNANIRKAVYA